MYTVANRDYNRIHNVAFQKLIEYQHYCILNMIVLIILYQMKDHYYPCIYNGKKKQTIFWTFKKLSSLGWNFGGDIYHSFQLKQAHLVPHFVK